MDKTTRSIFITLAILVIIVIALTYYRTIVRKDYAVFPDETVEEEPAIEEGIPFEMISEVNLGFPEKSEKDEETENATP